MKIAVVSDIHLKLTKHADFERDRFRSLIDNLAYSQANIIVFNGDLLDRARPSLEELSELFRALDILNNKKVFIIAGNHEAVSKDISTYDLLHIQKAPETLHINGVSIRFTHWNDIQKLHELPPTDILISHYRSAMKDLYPAELDDTFTKNYKLVLLGDIHDRYSPHKNVFYTGCPYPIHYTDRKVEYGYIMLDVQKSNFTWGYVDLRLPKKLAITTTFDRYKTARFSPYGSIYKVYISGTLDELNTLQNTSRIEYVKNIEVQEAVVEIKKLGEVSFIDTLVTQVNLQIKNNNEKTKTILLDLQGET